MSMPEPEHLVVARADEVEPLLSDARAQVARLTLQIRSTNHEADELEAALANDDTSARDLLRMSLDELIDSRRHELDQALEQELVKAAASVSAAQDEAARERLASPARPPSRDSSAPMPPRRLEVVSQPLTEEEGTAAIPPDGPGAVVPPSLWAPVVESTTVDAGETEEPAVEVGVPETSSSDSGSKQAVGSSSTTLDVEDDDATWQPPSAGQATVQDGPSDVSADPALLRELVSAAVTAAVAQAVAHRGGSAGPRSWVYEPTGVHVPLPTAPQPPRRPFWRQLLHVDVILPLVLVVIVFVVLLAWAG